MLLVLLQLVTVNENDSYSGSPTKLESKPTASQALGLWLPASLELGALHLVAPSKARVGHKGGRGDVLYCILHLKSRSI
jgi:hypothetical protein